MLVLGFIIFFPSFLNLDFFWDDERFIFLNPSVLQAPSWYFFWDPHSVFYKAWPLGYSFFWMFLKYAHIHNLIFYKSLNIIFHSLNSFLVYQILKKINITHAFALFLSFVFLVHPLHVEVVSWTFQLLTLLSFHFFGISFLFFLDFIKNEKKRTLIISFFFFLASLWTKSIAILLPFSFLGVLWINKSRKKNYLFLLPFFALSFYLGLINQRGAQLFTKNSPGAFFSRFLNYTDDEVASFFPTKKKAIHSNDDTAYFDFVFNKKKSPPIISFSPAEIFSQGSFHYFKKALLPFNLQFIYPSEKFSWWKIFTIPLFMFFIPLFFYFKKKNRMYFFASFLGVPFLLPYLGLTYITFFYWSNVSDRYAYFFLFSLLLFIGIFFSSSSFFSLKKLPPLFFASLLILSALNITQGLKFNRPFFLYEEIIAYKKHPILYSLLFEEHLRKLDLEKSEHVLNEALVLFPDDPYLLQDQFRLNVFKKNNELNKEESWKEPSHRQ